MSQINKLLALGGLIGSVFGKRLLRAALSNLVTAAIFAVISVLLLIAVLAGICYIGYLALAHYAVSPPLAAGIVTLVLVALAGIFIILTRWRIRAIKRQPRKILLRWPPTAYASQVAFAFLDGFFEKDAPT